MKAEEAKRRYDLTLVKQDQYYTYIAIKPRFDADKADFQQARLVLNKDSFLPRQLWFEQPNGNEVTWDIPKIQSNATLDRKEFGVPQTPPGWTFVRQPPAPRVVRPQTPARELRWFEPESLREECSGFFFPPESGTS